MAEQEVTKHSRKILRIWKSPAGWKHKASEIIFEIVIIVFALSLTLLLERWREKKHEQAIANNFLTGLKSDLESSVADLGEVKKSYAAQKNAFNYFLRVIHTRDTLNRDSLKSGYFEWVFYFSTTYNPKVSRFEGLKSAGQLYYVENKKLLNEILTLYQNVIAWHSYLITRYVIFKTEKLMDYYDRNVAAEGNKLAMLAVLLKNPVMIQYFHGITQPCPCN